MTITYKWIINNTASILEADQFHSYVIYSVNWTLTASSGAAVASTSGKTRIGDADVIDFTPYNEVTTEQLISWVESALGESTVNTMKAALAAQVEKQLNSPLNNLPFAAQMG